MTQSNSERADFRYYPYKDGEPKLRNSRIDLAHEGGEWWMLGRKRPLSSAEYKKYKENLEEGRAEIQKVVSSAVREDGKAEFLSSPPDGPYQSKL